MATADDDALREMAAHRGMRLIKSRRRRPGGDFGKYGLVDARTKKPCFGQDDDGLTASAAAIAAHLRSDVASTWRESADKAPATKPARVAAPPPDEPAGIPSPPQPKAQKSPPEPKPRALLRIRAARPADADVLAMLAKQIGGHSDASTIASRLTLTARRQAPILVADRDEVVGCIAWTILPHLHHLPVARILMIAVAQNVRREGIGRALFEAARAAIGRMPVEAISEIDIRGARGFFRMMGFDRTAYQLLLPEE